MKPHNAPKSARAAEAAARTHLRAHLGWLRGFPAGDADKMGLAWITLPRLSSPARPANIKITRDLLRRTQFARNAARHKFPRVLAQIVGDVDAWTERSDAQLDLLKGAIHSHAALPDLNGLLGIMGARRAAKQRVANLVRRDAAAKPIIAALVWVHWHDEAGFAVAVEAVERHAAALARILARLPRALGLTAVLQCVQLAAAGGGAALIERLADARSWDVPLYDGGFPTRIQAELKAFWSGEAIAPDVLAHGFERPEPLFGPALAQDVPRLSACPAKIRDRQLRMLELMIPQAHLDGWAAWWRNAEAIERDVRRLLNIRRRPLEKKDAGAARALAMRVTVELEQQRPLRWDYPGARMADICADASPKAFDELSKCMEHLSAYHAGQFTRNILLDHWAAVFHDPERGWGVVGRLLAAQRGLLERLRPLAPHVEAWVAGGLTEEMIETWVVDANPQSRIEPAIDALARLIAGAENWNKSSGPFRDHTGWESLIAAVELTGKAALAAEALMAVPPQWNALHGKAWTALLQLADGSMDRFRAMAKGWDQRHWHPSVADDLPVLTKTPDLAGLIVQSLIAGEGRRLSRLVDKLRLGRALGLAGEEQPANPPTPIDLAPYPPELHEPLKELARWDRRPGRSADRMLAADFPIAASLETELTYVRKLAKRTSGKRKAMLEARARKLKRRLETPARISMRRLDRHRAKLTRRILHARLDRWDDHLNARLCGGLEAVMGMAPPTDWLRRPEVMRLLTSLAGLKPEFRNLAFRLLKRRCGPKPLDLRADTANDAFLAELRRRGIRTSPWLDGIAPREIMAGPNRLRLGFEDDPLEIMRMGEPFETCLAPGDFNFFSAVANAADINKRVLYARDGSGTIQGRCLLALTDDGHVLTFNVYAHAHREAVQRAVTAFTLELAEEMGTSVVAKGPVRRLMTSDWYDDGSIDLTGQLKCLAPGSDFLTQLESLAPEAMLPALRQNLGGHPINAAVIAALSRTRALQTRPQLVLPLVPLLQDAAALDPMSRIGLVELVRRAGATKLALDMLKPLPEIVRARDHHDSWLPVRLGWELIALGLPHRALRLIQRSRPHWVKDWPEEWEERILVAAKALAALHRPRKALELFRIASENGSKEAAYHAKEIERQLRSAHDASDPPPNE